MIHRKNNLENVAGRPACCWAVPVLVVVALAAGLPGDLSAQNAPQPPAARDQDRSLVRQVQNVKDFVRVAGAAPIELRGEGIVTGLNGNGDSAGGETETMIRHYLSNLHSRNVGNLNIKNVALVLVTARLEPFQKVGTTVDIRVTAIGDAKSLAGGTLMMTALKGINPLAGKTEPQEVIYSLAQGSVLIEGDVRNGNPTSGTVPNGGVIKRELKRKIVRTLPYETPLGGQYVRLVLKRPDYNTAATVTNQINEMLMRYFDEEAKVWKYTVVARTVDAGSIDVVIPTEEAWRQVGTLYPGFEREPVMFIHRIFDINVPVDSIPGRARVTINDVTKTIAHTAEVIVRQGRVRVGNLTVGYEDRTATLGEILDQASALNATKQELIDIVRALNAAGMLEAEVTSR